MSNDVPGALQWFFDVTYLSHALDGSGSLIFGFNRTKLNCNEIYCHFQDPRKFVNVVGLQENLPKVFHALTITLVLIHTANYCIMRYRLGNRR